MTTWVDCFGIPRGKPMFQLALASHVVAGSLSSCKDGVVEEGVGRTGGERRRNTDPQNDDAINSE
jgi:hypothetical protein